MKFVRKVYAKYNVLPSEAAARVNLKGLEAEAAKYKTFKEFKKAFSVDIKHGHGPASQSGFWCRCRHCLS